MTRKPVKNEEIKSTVLTYAVLGSPFILSLPFLFKSFSSYITSVFVMYLLVILFLLFVYSRLLEDTRSNGYHF